MEKLLLAPPAAFLVILVMSGLLARLSSKLAFRAKKQADGTGKPYACGEDGYDHMAQPDYSTFFPFAFFFIIAHVATLMMATVPMETVQIFILAVLYMACVVMGLYILLREK